MAVGFEAFDQLDTTHTGHHRIDQKTPFPASTIGFEEGRAIGESLHRISVFVKQIPYRLPDGAVVVNNEDRGRLLGPFQT